MAKKTTSKTTTHTTSSDDHHSMIELIIYANLLHGAFKQPERFEVYAKNCAKFAKVAAKIAIDEGLVAPVLGSFGA